MNPTTTPPTEIRNVRRAFVQAWLACGVLDIASAVILTVYAGGKPARMLQGIAASVIGPQSFEMGASTAVLGLAMHFLVALAATSVFYAASRRFPAMLAHPILSGVLFGVFWLLVMYRGVIPLLAEVRTLYLTNPPRRPLPEIWPIPLIVHVLCVGLPISLFLSRAREVHRAAG